MYKCNIPEIKVGFEKSNMHACNIAKSQYLKPRWPDHFSSIRSYTIASNGKLCTIIIYIILFELNLDVNNINIVLNITYSNRNIYLRISTNTIEMRNIWLKLS